MNGMKEGAGEDPFADDDAGETEATAESREETRDDAVLHGGSQPEDDGGGDNTRASSTEHELPWAVRRDSVKSDRPEVVQIPARKETVEKEPEFFRAVEDELEEAGSVYKLDVREAALLVAMEHPEEVAAKMREWGCQHL